MNRRRMGLDYLGVEAAARLLGVRVSPEEFALIQAMEYEIVKMDHADG